MTNNQAVNINPEAEILPGVINANEVPWLWEQMHANGESVTEREHNEEIRKRIELCIEKKGSLREVVSDYVSNEEDIVQLLYSYSELQKDESPSPALTEVVTDVIAEMITEMIDSINDFRQGEFHEESLELKTEEYEYILKYLDGVPFVWILKSKYLTRGNLSSTIPNVVDLSSPNINGYSCYAAHPDFFNEGMCPYEIEEI